MTAYSHQSRFANGISPGAACGQGQVIGYLGNTGLSTGPHLHYEVIVNGHFVDPMKIRLPRGRELDGRALAEFKRQREQVDGLMQRAGSLDPPRPAHRAALSPSMLASLAIVLPVFGLIGVGYVARRIAARRPTAPATASPSSSSRSPSPA